MDIKYYRFQSYLSWGLIHVVFHCPENAGRYTQVFEMNLFQVL